MTYTSQNHVQPPRDTRCILRLHAGPVALKAEQNQLKDKPTLEKKKKKQRTGVREGRRSFSCPKVCAIAGGEEGLAAVTIAGRKKLCQLCSRKPYFFETRCLQASRRRARSMRDPLQLHYGQRRVRCLLSVAMAALSLSTPAWGRVSFIFKKSLGLYDFLRKSSSNESWFNWWFSESEDFVLLLLRARVSFIMDQGWASAFRIYQFVRDFKHRVAICLNCVSLRTSLSRRTTFMKSKILHALKRILRSIQYITFKFPTSAVVKIKIMLPIITYTEKNDHFGWKGIHLNFTT